MGAAEGNQFVATWIIENFSCCVLKNTEFLYTPAFIIEMPASTKWNLRLYPKGCSGEVKHIGLFLERKGTSEDVIVGYEFEILNKEGFVSHSKKIERRSFNEPGAWGISKFFVQNDIFVQRKDLLPMDSLTLRARIWKADGNLTDTTHCFVKTRMHKETVSSFLSIDKFSSITTGTKEMVWKQQVSEKSPKLKVNFSLKGGIYRSEYLCFEVEVEDSKEYKLLIATFSVLNNHDEKVETKEDEIRLDSNDNPKVLKLSSFLQKETLIRKGYLKNDSLRLYIKFLVLKGVENQSIESCVSGLPVLLDSKHFSEIIPTKNDAKETSTRNSLNHDLQKIQIDQSLSDVTLKVGTQSFPAHRVLLSARSPVFKAMFTSDMKESVEGVVQVQDSDSKTVENLLSFIYTDTIKILDMESAKKLYAAADKYQVLLLKKKCCDYLLEHLSMDNMCDLLVLTDMHQDTSFKSSVITNIVDNYIEILETDIWRSFIGSHSGLAAEVMYQMLSNRKS